MIQLGGLQSAAVRGEQEWCIAHLLQRLTAEAVDHLAHQEALRRHVHDGETGIDAADRSEEHTSELQSLMRISYAVFCLKKKTATTTEQADHIVTKTIQCDN